MCDAVVIGAGFGGLSAAISLAAEGLGVVVLEAADALGGKAGTHEVEGVRFDTGPSVVTLPHVIDEVLQLAGHRLSDHLQLRQPEPAFRYVFDDGALVDVHHALDDTVQSVHGALGAEAARDLSRFAAYAQRIWDAAAPNFVYGPAPTLWGVARLGPRAWWQLPRVDAWRTMWGAIRRQVRSPHLAAILARYATYNGSDPRRAPATLNCIAHVEMALGGHGISGGLGAVVDAFAAAARQLGVQLRTGCAVQRIRTEDGRATGVITQSGEVIEARQVVVNADASHLFGALLADEGVPAPTSTPSMSGYTAVLRARPSDRRAANTVVMSSPYLQEFEDIFDADRPPQQPTVYLCDQTAHHGIEGWSDGVPLFAMANAPAEPVAGEREAAVWVELRERMLQRAVAAGVVHSEDRVVWERTPRGLADRFPGSHGSLYGAASNGPWAAFRRPANRVPGVSGVYLASGSAHPGGGMPLAILSGRAAARDLLEGVQTR
ncbi:MAG: phytoene desaturase [Myxococcales bacterium]|nr:phytoene desaturase [Myxococcales bacterium]